MAFDFSAENLDREFPVRRNVVYWNHAAVAPLPRRVADAITAHIDNVRDRGAADWRAWYSAIDETRGKAAQLIGARASEIAFLPSTSWALNFVAQAFAWKSGDNVVGDDMEFPANVYPWMLLERRGVEYRLARNRDGRIGVDEIAAVVDARTRVVAVSWVAFHNGWVYPIEEIGAFCREKGILFVVDAIQGLGALPLDIADSKVDVLAADSHKWLLGAEACAVFYVSEGARERVPAAFGGWWNVRHETSHARGYLDYRLDFHLGGQRYEPGSLPTAQVKGLSAALDLLDDMKVEENSWRIVENVSALAEGLRERGWKIATPEPFRSGILSAVPPDGDARRAAKELEARGIIASPREGGVRFSPHAYNDLAEVERILRTLFET
ncbi:MAG TPA: aminotransferase class V-fold PLP-dependent enzyme [Thermoanaerobaculia bacterium]|jgi:selenocysteine lyase/cysteine desulfurase|nr:aminotransferase class V-fold PLP-dependent enzyme [Thermoanaerobaculia bacterium]